MNLREYAAQITAHAEKLQSHLDRQDEKVLSFEADAIPSKLFPQELQESRLALMSACVDMHDLVDGAESMMTMYPFTVVQNVGAMNLLTHYKLWSRVPESGSISFEDIAKPLKLEVNRLTAYMRNLIAIRIFREPEPGRVAHSAASLFVKRNEALQCWIAACIDDMLEAALALPKTYDQHGLSLDPHLSAFNIARGDSSVNGMSLVLSDRQRGARYSKGLGWLATAEIGSSGALLDAYDWDQFGLVVDVAGGDGNFSFSLARRNPNTRFVIQDIAAQASYFKPPPDIANRLEYQVHDIFTQQPVQADAYVLRIVLHVFGDDEKAAVILRNILPAMKDTSRILLMDMKLAPQEAPTAWARVETSINTVMHSLGGRDRNIEEWAKVVYMASPDLELGKVVSPPGKLWSLIEVRKSPSQTGELLDKVKNVTIE